MPERHILASDATMGTAWNVTICHLRVCEDKMSPLSSSLMEQLYGGERKKEKKKKVSIPLQQSWNIYQGDLLSLSCSPPRSLSVFISSPVIQPLLPILATIGIVLEVAADPTLQQWQASQKKKNPIYFSMSQDSGLCALMLSEACL